jgi:hypothetical protein
LFAADSQYDDNFADVRSQEMAKRAITIASAGSHNLLMLFTGLALWLKPCSSTHPIPKVENEH